jgi:hypothetical protein
MRDRGGVDRVRGIGKVEVVADRCPVARDALSVNIRVESPLLSIEGPVEDAPGEDVGVVGPNHGELAGTRLESDVRVIFGSGAKRRRRFR